MYDNNSIRPRVVVALCRWSQAPASNTEKVDPTEKLLGTPSSFSTYPHMSNLCDSALLGL